MRGITIQPWGALRAPLVLASAVLGVAPVACGRALPQAVADGEPVTDAQDAFSVVVPSNWAVQDTVRGLVLTRSVSYGGGFPQILIRLLDGDAPGQSFDEEGRHPGGRASWRYARWSNARGQGFRLEMLVTLDSGGRYWAEASVWDPAPTVDRRFFDAEILPILNSLRDP